MPTVWTDTSLHAPGSLGGMSPVGSGSLGETYWTPLADSHVTEWLNTSLHAPGALGGMQPVGSGSLGETAWETST